MARSLALACLLLLAVTTATAPGATAPGRVAFSITGQVPQFGDGGARAAASAVLPGGSVVTFAYDSGAQTTVAAKLLRNGALDPAFGSGGIVRLTAPGPSFRVSQAELLADGRLLIAGARLHPTTLFPGRIVLLRLLPDGALDLSFGAGGVLPTSLLASGAAPMAVAPDGAIIVTGTLQSPTETTPLNPSTTEWVVAKLTPDGVADASFAVARIPVGSARKARGSSVVVTPAGSIIALGYASPPAGSFKKDVLLLAGLTALGTPDPAFNGGAPALVPLDDARSLHLRASGALDVFGQQGIVRFGAGGALDPSFAAGGRIAFETGGSITSFVATADGGGLIAGLPSPSPAPVDRDRRITVRRLTSAGALAGSTVLHTPFGGGQATVGGKREERSVEQNSFEGELLRRDDGSFLAIGAVSVFTPGGRMDGAFAPFVAAQAFTPALTPDPTFGGPQQPASVRVRVHRQRAVVAARRRFIDLRLTAAQAGLVRLRVRDRRGRIIASGTHALYAPGPVIVHVLLTTPGRQMLERAPKGLRIAVRHDYRDILTARATGVTKGRLR